MSISAENCWRPIAKPTFMPRDMKRESAAMASPAPKLFEDVVVGETLPALRMAISLTTLVAYAGATWDFHRYHYDGAVAASLGLPGPLMDGQMIGALLARQLMAWAGADAFVRKLNFRLRE